MNRQQRKAQVRMKTRGAPLISLMEVAMGVPMATSTYEKKEMNGVKKEN